MITSVMSIHAKHRFTQRIWDSCSGGSRRVQRGCGASTETSFKILKRIWTGLSREEQSMPTGRARTGGQGETPAKE